MRETGEPACRLMTEVGAKHTPEGAHEACGEPPCPPRLCSSVLSLTAGDVADSSVCFSDVSCSFFFFFAKNTSTLGVVFPFEQKCFVSLTVVGIFCFHVFHD